MRYPIVLLLTSSPSLKHIMVPQTIYNFIFRDITGKEFAFSQLKNQVLLIVNTASACGLTPQYKELQSLYDKYKDKGFSVIAFPCNQFLSQENKSPEEIQDFIKSTYGVTFPVMEKSDVNGDKTNEIFSFLKEACPGFMVNTIKWNFKKFLIDRNGNPVKRYSPTTTPFAIEKDILRYLSLVFNKHTNTTQIK